MHPAAAESNLLRKLKGCLKDPKITIIFETQALKVFCQRIMLQPVKTYFGLANA